MKCEVKSNFIINAKLTVYINYCNFNYCKYTKMDIGQHATSNYMHRVRLGPPRSRRPLAFVQPCPMGVTPLFTQNVMSISINAASKEYGICAPVIFYFTK